MVSIFDFPIETFIQGHIINEDGTIFDPPENPLLKKWKEKYPARSEPNNSQVCDGYSCTFCSRCPSGDGWEVPEEDRAEYDIWVHEYFKYIKTHSPSWIKEMKSDECRISSEC